MTTNANEYLMAVAKILARDYFSPDDNYTIQTDTNRDAEGTPQHSIRILPNHNKASPPYYIDKYLQQYEPEAAAHSIFEEYNKSDKSL